jgi:hypothetical protein
VGLILAIAAVIGVAFVFRFVDSERERDLRAWQIRLGIVADSRFAAVSEWVEEQYAHLTVLAENAALQIYMTELTLAGGDREQVTEEAAQAGYLRNLLVVAASRGRFTGRPTGPAVGANVQRVGVAGIALLDMTGRVIVSTPEMPPIEGALRPFVTTAPRGARALESVHEGAAGTPTMAFIAPVFAVQGEVGASEQIGMVLGVKEIDQGLYPRLRQPGAAEATAETLLVRSTGTVVEYLSPLGDGTPALQRTVALSTDELAAAFAISTPGGFAIKRDYRDQEVLVTGRAFAIAPWTLVHKINRAEALADSDARLTRILAVFLLTIAVISAAILAVWWHGSSRRAQESAASYRGLAQRFESQGRFLQLVTDSQPNLIFIVDEEEGRLRFANRMTAQRAGVESGDLTGKTLAAVFGSDEAKRYQAHVKDVVETGAPVSAVDRIGGGDGMQVVQSEHIPLAETEDQGGGVLVVERDITAAVTERERRERIQRQLVQTLVAVVDRRDPYAANHSMRVGTVARAIAEEMDLEPIMVETVEIAGSLMNLGKILVPKEVLTKGESLSEEEIKQVRDSIQTSADLIEGIEFDGPVVETLRQLQERWDGAGVPLGLAGDEILITAQIVAVANAFVAMVSPRAYRPGSSFDEAVETLLSEIRKAFERRPVAALVNYLDSRRGRERWAHFTAPPAGT